ncbi:hypothetical protein DKX38_025756 [Salix brachista]|uniref:Metallothionein-like protein n=2 Tax=Saliceae TaxID=238069 RepID=A0A5N5K2M1_9ROSI|nr:hypothetical protein DKX38_025756 [Salix brachista]
MRGGKMASPYLHYQDSFGRFLERSVLLSCLNWVPQEGSSPLSGSLSGSHKKLISLNKKRSSYTADIVETEKSYVVMEVPADENDGKCKCGTGCTCTTCTCGH